MSYGRIRPRIDRLTFAWPVKIFRQIRIYATILSVSRPFAVTPYTETEGSRLILDSERSEECIQ